MKSVLRKTIIPLWLTIGLGLSACATQEQIGAELESEEGRALIKGAVQEEMKAMKEMMGSEEHKAKMKEMMMKTMKEMMESEEHKAKMKEMMMETMKEMDE